MIKCGTCNFHVDGSGCDRVGCPIAHRYATLLSRKSGFVLTRDVADENEARIHEEARQKR